MFEINKTRKSAAASAAFAQKSIPLQNIITREAEIEEATRFLVEVIARPIKIPGKKAKKPVVMHGLRVGFWLMARGYPVPVIIAGLLHDVLEKTTISVEGLRQRFGGQVAAIVVANTVMKVPDMKSSNALPTSSLQLYRESVRRCIACGNGALQVRAADLVDNCERQIALGNVERLRRIHAKFEILLKACTESLEDKPLLAELKERERWLRQIRDSID